MTLAPAATAHHVIIMADAGVLLTVRLDREQAARLQSLADAENTSLMHYVEVTLARMIVLRDEADRTITVMAAPGASTQIDSASITRGDGESDSDYARRQALLVELWSIADRL